MKLYTGKTAIEAAIKSIATAGKRLDANIQKTAISAALHTALHGECGYVNQLIEAMPKGSRVNALHDWFTNFGPVNYNATSKAFEVDKIAAAEMLAETKAGHPIPAMILEGAATVWTEFAPDKPYQPMDFTAIIKAAVAKAQARIDSGKGDKINPVLLKAVAALVPAK